MAIFREFIDWSFRAPQADKRYARSAMVVCLMANFVGMVLFVALNVLR